MTRLSTVRQIGDLPLVHLYLRPRQAQNFAKNLTRWPPIQTKDNPAKDQDAYTRYRPGSSRPPSPAKAADQPQPLIAAQTSRQRQSSAFLHVAKLIVPLRIPPKLSFLPVNSTGGLGGVKPPLRHATRTRHLTIPKSPKVFLPQSLSPPPQRLSARKIRRSPNATGRDHSTPRKRLRSVGLQKSAFRPIRMARRDQADAD